MVSTFFTNTNGKKTIEIKKQHLIDLELSKNNTASFKDALGLGVPLKKQWIGTLYYIDKKPFYCHTNYEALGFSDMDYEYSPGLKFPGDPDCMNKKETENCKCSIGFKVLEY